MLKHTEMKYKCVIFLTIVFLSGGEGFCQKDQFSRVHRVDISDINSHKLTSNMEMRSLTMCAKYCMTENGCKSFSYTENNRNCDTYSKAIMETTAAPSSSIKYFSKPPTSDIYDYIVTDGPTIPVYIDMDTENGPWIVIQRRTNAAVDFYRNWADYKYGFGDLLGNFWLGNDNIHLLTRTSMILRVELEAWDGTTGYAQYSSFQIANEAQNYKLSVSGFSGNVSYDALAEHDGYDFTTYDRDNDFHIINCASVSMGAWWYHGCHASNLNGLYKVDIGEVVSSSMIWASFPPQSGIGAPLKKCIMMIRKP